MLVYSKNQLLFLVEKIFTNTGCTLEDAKNVAQVLISAEMRGISSHGLMRIKDYVGLWQKKRINMQPNLKIVHETHSTGTVDADKALGMVAGKFAMELAIKKAFNVGSGWVAVRNSNHFGIAGFYTMMAAKNDMIGFAMTNANALVSPAFGIERLLGTNPIAFSIPGKNEPILTVDMATTPIARGKLELMEKQGIKIPEGNVQDENGNASTDPAILKRGGTILPLGAEANHKGYCLSSMVDILSAILSGANFGPFVPPQVAFLEPKENPPGLGLGHFFGAIRLDGFRPTDEIKEYLDKWIKTFRNSKPSEGHNKVFVPGELELAKEKDSAVNGIEILPQVWQELAIAANIVGIDINNIT